MNKCLRHDMRSRLLALLVVTSTLLAGCYGDGKEIVIEEQVSLFEKLRKSIPSNYASLAASSGIFLGPNFHFDLCRA